MFSNQYRSDDSEMDHIQIAAIIFCKTWLPLRDHWRNLRLFRRCSRVWLALLCSPRWQCDAFWCWLCDCDGCILGICFLAWMQFLLPHPLGCWNWWIEAMITTLSWRRVAGKSLKIMSLSLKFCTAFCNRLCHYERFMVFLYIWTHPFIHLARYYVHLEQTQSPPSQWDISSGL